jgi:hypothetical protein
MPFWNRQTRTYICASVIWPALRRMRQMTASEIRHPEVARGVTYARNGVSMSCKHGPPRPKVPSLQHLCSIFAAAERRAQKAAGSVQIPLSLSWQHRSGQTRVSANGMRAALHLFAADDGHGAGRARANPAKRGCWTQTTLAQPAVRKMIPLAMHQSGPCPPYLAEVH